MKWHCNRDTALSSRDDSHKSFLYLFLFLRIRYMVKYFGRKTYQRLSFSYDEN